MTVSLSILQLTNFYLAMTHDSQSNDFPLTTTLRTITKEPEIVIKVTLIVLLCWILFTV